MINQDEPCFTNPYALVRHTSSRFSFKVATTLLLMSKLRISAIVPYFEAHKTIESALRSLMEGDLAPDEIIIVNDGSSQESREKLREIVLKLRSAPITIVDHQHNLGGGFARNTAVLNSKNGWIFCLDADNLAPKSLLKTLADFISENARGTEIASPERAIFFDDSSVTVSHAWTFRNSQLSSEEYINRTVLPGASGNYLFSKESWYKSGGYPTGARALDAWGFGLRLHLAGYRTYAVPGTYYFHRIGIHSYYVRESRDTERLSLLATAQLLENSPRLPKELIRRRLSARKARNWLRKIGGAAAYNDPRLASDEGFSTPREAIPLPELQDLERMLHHLEHHLERK